jgi:dTDP-4-dehydrorhamnose reductase
MIKKIIIFGSNGMLGSYLMTYFTMHCKKYDVIGISRASFEVNEESLINLEERLASYEIDGETCVINCIGLIPQRRPADWRDYYVMNAVFPQRLSAFCKKAGAKLILPTTDCVFSGLRADGSYLENDVHDEKGHYGASKSLGETHRDTIIRCSIIGEEIYGKKSFLEWVRSATGGTIDVWANHMWNGITCLQYCRVVQKIIDDGMFWQGVRHLHSPHAKSKYELACIIDGVYGLGLQINKVIADQVINKTLKTHYSVLNESFDIPSLEDQIAELPGFLA